MALLTYLIMVAALITSAFVGYEWVATSSMPKVAVYSTTHAKAVRLATRAKLASKAKFAATASSPLPTVVSDNDKGPPNSTTATDESKQNHRIARVRSQRARIVTQRLTDGSSQMALGYAEEPRMAPNASFER